MHSPLWHVAWSTLHGPGGPGGRGGFLLVVVEVVVMTGGGVGRLASKTNLWLISLIWRVDATVSERVSHPASNPCCSRACYNLPAKTEATHRNWSHHSCLCSRVCCHTGIPSGYMSRRHTCAHLACRAWYRGLLKGTPRGGGEGRAMAEDEQHASQGDSAANKLDHNKVTSLHKIRQDWGEELQHSIRQWLQVSLW